MTKITQIVLILLPILAWSDFPFSCRGVDLSGETHVEQKDEVFSAIEGDALVTCRRLRLPSLARKPGLDPLQWHGAY